MSRLDSLEPRHPIVARIAQSGAIDLTVEPSMSRVDRVVGRSLAGLPPPWHDRPGAGRSATGHRGFWKAAREVFPASRKQRCCFHKQANVIAGLPKSAHPGAPAAIKDIYNTDDIDHTQTAIKAFETDYAKYPKAVAKITGGADVLLEFYKYPAEHLG